MRDASRQSRQCQKSCRSGFPAALTAGLFLLSFGLSAQPLTLRMSPVDLSIQVTDSRNRVLWNSAPPEAQLADLNDAWAGFAKSGVSIDWYPKAAVVTRRASAATEGSVVSVTELPGGARGTVKFAQSGIELDVEVTVADDGILVRVPANGVRDGGDNRLARVWLYPFLGAAKGADPKGYLVLPDGPGTLVPFREKAPTGSEAWVKPVWGVDMADGTEPSWNSWDRVQWPVYGLVREEHKAAWVAELVSGGELASIQAWPAGVTTGFTWLTASFQVRKPYVQPTARTGAGITVVPVERQKTDLSVLYRFVAGEQATWLGLAQRVRKAWLASGVQKIDTRPASWNLTLLGAASTGQLVGRGEIVMTTAAQARALVDEASTFARAPGQIVLAGWQNGGEGWGQPATNQVGKGFAGTADGLAKLVADLKKKVPVVQLAGSVMLATDGNPGWNLWTDPALRYNTTALRFDFQGERPALTLLSPPAMAEKARAFAPFARATGAGVALWDEGSLLSGWGNSGGGGRVRALEERRALLQNLVQSSGAELTLLDPAQWALPTVRSIIGFPAWSSGLRWGGASVPFIPNLLHGLVALYGGDLNYSPDLPHDLLRMVDFGLGPSVYFTAEPTWKLEMSALRLFSSSWSDWKGPLKEALAWIAPALDLVQTRALVSRVEEAGPVVTETFDDGSVLVLDYRDDTYSLKPGKEARP